MVVGRGCSVASGKCRSSRDVVLGVVVGLLTSGKVPLEKTLDEEGRSQQAVNTAAWYTMVTVDRDRLT